MEAVLKRAGQKAKQADKSLAKRLKFLKNSKEWEIRRQREAARRYQSSLYAEERKRRKDHWLRGPLATRHDVGPNAKYYGTFDTQHLAFAKEFDARKPDWFHVADGDRVVVLGGRDAGKIGEVLKMDKERCSVRVKGLNLVEIKVPELIRDEVGGQDIVSAEREIPLKDVRLVYPLPHPETGIPRDVIIDQLEPVGREWDRHKRELDKGQRVISGTSTIVPWPEVVEHEETDHDADTRADLVDEATFRPQLLTAPMPLNLIDELRHKYSKFRTRHTYTFVQKMEEREAQKEKRKDLINTMQTPLQRLAALRAEQKAKEKRTLSPEQLAMIGEVMAQQRSQKEAKL